MKKSLFHRIALLSFSAMFMVTALPGVALAAAESGRGRRDRDSEFKVTEQETVRNTFPVTVSPEQRELIVDNVFGNIEVVGTNSDQVQLVVTKTYRAESKDKLELAKKEVTLDVKNESGKLKLYVNGPFRCNCDNCVHWDHDSGYLVNMDFQLQVPNRMKLTLKTVNDGNIKVQGVAGDYAVHNVNGDISMSDIAGSGRVETVNGAVKVTFRENPKADSDFRSINGNVELAFSKNLSADFRFKTFNGGVYSDFEMTALPQRQPESERRNGKFVYRSDRFTGGRVGSGGPEIKIENLNGDIRVLERHV
jgi:hypothetical protein